MKLRKSQAGFASIDILLVIVAVGLIGFVVLQAYNARQSATGVPTETPTTVNDVPSAPKINSAADLSTAEHTLDQVDPDTNNGDTAQLDNHLSAF